MAQLIIEIADADLERLRHAVAVHFGRPDTVPNPRYSPQELIGGDEGPVRNPDFDPAPTIPNPESLDDFLQRALRETFARIVTGVAQQEAEQAARTQAAEVAASFSVR